MVYWGESETDTEKMKPVRTIKNSTEQLRTRLGGDGVNLTPQSTMSRTRKNTEATENAPNW